MIRKKLIISVSLVFISAFSFAQEMKVNLYGMGVFNDNVDSYYDNTNYYNGRINGGFQWGGGFEFMARRNYGIELSYLRMDTKAPIQYYRNGVQHTNFDLATNYILLGGNRYFAAPGGKVDGFLGLSLGADVIDLKNPDNGNSSSITKFAWGLKGGADFWIAPAVGIKLQAQLLSTVQSVGGGFYFGTGGAGAGLTTYSSMYQFGLGGGLVFKIPSGKK